MRAIRVHEFGEPSVLKLEQVPDPIPTGGQVLVGIRAVGVNPVETYVRSGKYAAKPPLPYTPGNDAAGVVESVGPGVSRFKRGDRVYIAGSLTGTYAEKTLASETNVHPLPDNTSFEQGAALGVPYATAYRALFHRGEAREGETLLIHGATGGVGLAALQFARAKKLRIIATGGTPEGRDLVKQQGAHLVLDHHAADYTDEILKFTGNQGVNLILEMLANVNLGKDLTLLGRRGRVMVIGSRGEVTINPRDAMAREADIRGVMLGGASPAEYTEMHKAIVEGLGNGALSPVIGQKFPLDQAPAAHDAAIHSKALGKIVLIP